MGAATQRIGPVSCAQSRFKESPLSYLSPLGEGISAKRDEQSSILRELRVLRGEL